MSELFSKRSLETLERRMADLKMRELFEEPSSYEDEEEDEDIAHMTSAHMTSAYVTTQDVTQDMIHEGIADGTRKAKSAEKKKKKKGDEDEEEDTHTRRTIFWKNLSFFQTMEQPLRKKPRTDSSTMYLFRQLLSMRDQTLFQCEVDDADMFLWNVVHREGRGRFCGPPELMS